MRFQLDASKLSRLLYFAIVLLITFLLLISCVFLLSQAVRNSPTRAWTDNVNALVIGGSYVLVVCLSTISALERDNIESRWIAFVFAVAMLKTKAIGAAQSRAHSQRPDRSRER